MISAVTTIVIMSLGLVYILIAFVIGFAIANALGFVAPLPHEKPNKRWLKRQAKKAGRRTDVERLVRRLEEANIGRSRSTGWFSMRREDFDKIIGDFSIRHTDDAQEDTSQMVPYGTIVEEAEKARQQK